MKVIVISGGLSAERDVSIKTGEAVFKACIDNNYQTDSIILNKNFIEDLSDYKKADIIFNALHGAFGEDGVIQKILEKNDIKYTGSGSKASSLCIDKIECKKIVEKNGILTPKWFKSTENFKITENFFPCIVKPNSQGSTFGLSFVDNPNNLNKAISNSLEYDSNSLIEEYISGREITVGVLDNKSLPIVEIFPKNFLYDYKCKYTAGMSRYKCPAKIDDDLAKKIMRDSVKIFNILGCKGYGRVDFILDSNNNYYFLEINTLPGMTATSLLPIAAKSSGLSFKNLIKKIIDLGLIS